MRDPLRPRLRHRIPPHVGSVSVRLVVGIFVLVLGILFLISNLHIFDAYPRHFFWPAVFSAIGIALIIERRSEHSWQWGVAWIVAGLWSLAYQYGWVDVGFWEIIFPLLMLGGGAYLVRRALSERHEQSGDAQSATKVQGVGVLSGSEQKPSMLERAELFALMGGVKLDLFGTTLVNNTATINVAAVMGGIEICAPSEWTVVNRVTPVMGAFVDKRRPAAMQPVPEQAKTIVIDGFVLMGGVEIKN